MNFEKLWRKCYPNIRISGCGGICGVKKDDSMRVIFIDVEDVMRIYLKPDGTYKLYGPLIRSDK